MPQYDVHAVQRGVCHLVKLNRATRQHNGKCYQYFAKAPGGDVSEGRSALKINRADTPAVSEQEEAPNPAVTGMMDMAQGLFEKGSTTVQPQFLWMPSTAPRTKSSG